MRKDSIEKKRDDDDDGRKEVWEGRQGMGGF